MITKPKISVIIPNYGTTTYLSEAIDSVFQQTLSADELIIVDDNNPSSKHRHETREIIERQKSYGRNINYIEHDRNKNGSVARNTGFAASTGDFISFLDNDDFYINNRLEVLSGILAAASSSVAGVYSGVEFRRGGRTYHRFHEARTGNFLAESLACKFMLGTGSNLFLRRSVLHELGGFDETFWRTQDYEFIVRVFKKYNIAGIPEILVVKNNENLNLPDFKKSLANKEQYLLKYKDLVDQQDRATKGYIIKSNYVYLGELALKEGLRKESAAMYKIAIQSSNLSLRDIIRRAILWIYSLKM